MDIYLFRDLDHLRQTGNFSQAAERSNLSQPAFSRRIRSLEAWVGATLVDRSHQPVSLTDAGAQMLEAGMHALSRIEQERGQIIEAQSLPDKYVVAFGAQHSIGWRFFPAWLQALEGAYGPFLSRLRVDDLPGCLDDLAGATVDFVIAYQDEARSSHSGSRRISSFQSLVIGHDRLIPVCKPDASGRPVFRFDNPSIEMPFLRFGDAAPISKQLQPLLRAKGLNQRLRTVYENTMAGALRIRARAGDGVAWLPESLVAPDMENRQLVRTGAADWDVGLEIRLYANNKPFNRTTGSIWSFLENRGGQPLLPEEE